MVMFEKLREKRFWKRHPVDFTLATKVANKAELIAFLESNKYERELPRCWLEMTIRTGDFKVACHLMGKVPMDLLNPDFIPFYNCGLHDCPSTVVAHIRVSKDRDDAPVRIKVIGKLRHMQTDYSIKPDAWAPDVPPRMRYVARHTHSTRDTIFNRLIGTTYLKPDDLRAMWPQVRSKFSTKLTVEWNEL
jgi:hypothetical protein